MSVISHSGQIGNICRTCLSQERYMKSVFDTDSSLGETLQLFEMLMACTSVLVQEDDGLPAQICLSCINYISRSFSFKKLCEESDATLREALRKSAITADDDEDDKPLIELKRNLDVALCSQETLAGIDRDMLDIGIKFEEGETTIDDPSKSCSIPSLIAEDSYTDCGNGEIKMTIINVDNLETQSIDVAFNEDTKPDINDNPILDEIDSKTDTSLIDNEQSTSPMPDDSKQPIYPCKECNACFTIENALKIHSDTHRKPTTKHKCNVCGKEFAQLQSLRTHLNTHNGEKRYVCKLCDKRFAHAISLRGHMRAHSMRAHSNQKNFMCSVCGKGFARRTNRNTHQMIHSHSELYSCNVCDRKLCNGRSLARHMLIHTNMKDHACSECDKRFVTLKEWMRHQRSHTG